MQKPFLKHRHLRREYQHHLKYLIEVLYNEDINFNSVRTHLIGWNIDTRFTSSYVTGMFIMTQENEIKDILKIQKPDAFGYFEITDELNDYILHKIPDGFGKYIIKVKICCEMEPLEL